MTEMLRLGCLASHGGSNLQAIIDACKSGRLNAAMRVVISNNSGSVALQRARREAIPAVHLSGATHPRPEELDGAIVEALERHEVGLVILAGYLKLVGPQTIARFRGRILNIHPGLLPRFGGEGMYGRAVHQAVLASGVHTTGVTIHVVDGEFDHGPTVAQCELPVLSDDTADSLAERVLKREHEFYVETLQRIERGELRL